MLPSLPIAGVPGDPARSSLSDARTRRGGFSPFGAVTPL